MTINTVVTMSSTEEGDIDRDRIVNGDLVPDEYFCPICQYLLWKPRSCSSCQHLFCEKCIQRWIKNPNSGKRCPFRCEPFEDRRCPPYVQSLLSRLNIHCRNSQFGCSEIVCYDQLENHENIKCEYLSQRCSECDKLVLVSKLSEHQQIVGLCIPYPIKCTICQNYIDKPDFREHFYECYQKKMDEFTERATREQNFLAITNGQVIPPNTGLAFFQSIINTMHLFEQQRQMAGFPTSLKGVDAVRLAREQNCGHFYHILIMLKFILLNWSNAPYFILIFSLSGFIAFVALSVGVYTIFCRWAYRHIYFGPFLIILLSYLSCYGTYMICQSMSDPTIIFLFGLFIFVWGCTSRASLEILEMNFLFNKPKLNIILFFISLFIIKIILLLIRLYYWSMPTYIAAAFVTLVNLYLGFKIYRVYANSVATTTTTNQLIMPV